MPRPRTDSNKSTAKAVAKVTQTTLPKGEDLLGSGLLRTQLAQAKEADKRRSNIGHGQ